MPRRAVLVLLAALLVAAAGAGSAHPVVAAPGGPCPAWPTSFSVPPEIRVLRVASGTVDTVPFRAYVENVLAWEWPSTYPAEALKAGAIAVKQYAWYYLMRPRTAYVTPTGACYHVRDDTNDQKYDPARTPHANHLAAVTATWPLTLRKSGTFFLSGYGPGTADTCGADLSSIRTRLAQRGVRACALAGMPMADILRIYLDPGLVIASGERLAGPDRFATGAAVSAATFGTGVPVVFVATGLDFPDALAAGPAAARLGGPVLLVGATGLSESVAAELVRLQPASIVVLGGPSVVGDDVLTALAAYAPTVTRIAGATRYETAAAASAATFAPGVPIAFVATGMNFPDALVGAAAGARLGGPVLLVPGDGVPEAVATELTRLQPARIRVLGGPSVVSDATLEALRAYSADVDRLAGATRYATAAAVSAALYEAGAPFVDLATGLNFPDALSAGPRGGPLLLVPPTGPLPPEAAMEAARLAPARLVALGSVGALSDAAVAGVAAALAGGASAQ
ncbi:MAG TPA: cell wall-binding repeat-containing protein [Candidatus Limnocylindrales bacterium]|nr:cell wall-binding repeat-containing protein [Candidatus Limnocylindrales bacterium]